MSAQARGVSFPVTTASAAAQATFDRGLALAYAFNYGLAEKTFRTAAELDPNCAMAWWGVALVNGPHINFPKVPPEKARAAWDAVGRARKLAGGLSPKEEALLAALEKRYVAQQPDDRRPLDEAYAAAMRDVSKAYPDDVNVSTLFAESMMDLRPWDLWTLEGTPQPGTEEIVATLERAMALDPRHPGANHLYVHTVEASPRPERAVPAADHLRDVAPGVGVGTGHLVHMPAHIYARVGRWHDALVANQHAMEADAVYRAENPRPGFFALYMLHNMHFYAYAAMMQGRSADALKAARQMVGSVPPELLTEFAPVADGYMIFVSEVLMRFGQWEALLAEPAPAEGLPLSRALWHFTRGAAFTALDKLDEAEAERTAFREAAAKVPEEWRFGNSPASNVLAVAAGVLDGEIAAKRGEFNTAILRLEEAVRIEDQLRYDEPPDWIQPVRHTLGAVLLRAGRHKGAETVYREDLAKYPGNGWSLFGLARALHLQNKPGEAALVERQFADAWADADMKMQSSCLCQPGV
ncbi:MAG: hypothetical protein HYZ00_07680 [Candidatus Hydrogenedentes bacterium]|nr:hypothetical protein [Candidatus Hydrogenedentota bacterium]